MPAIDLIATARHDEFSARVLMIALKVAQNVASEDPGADEHAARAAYASRVIRGEETPKLIAEHLVSSNPTITAMIEKDPNKYRANVPDNDIEFALASIWTARSRAFAIS